MEAGPELDGLVAERVMGFEIVWKAGPCTNTRYPWYADEDKGGIPKYSTNEAAALEVIPIVLKDWDPGFNQGYEGEFRALYHPDWWDAEMANRGPRWWAGFGKDTSWDSDAWLYEACAATLPHAICLAALEARGIE